MTLASLRALSLCAALTALAAVGCAQRPAQQHVQDEALRQELLRMQDADQAVRQRMNDEKWQNESLGREMNALDAAHTKRLLEIFKAHGFPGPRLVGRDGAQAAHTLVLHSPSLKLQKQALGYLKKALRRGEVPPDAVANLTDIILTNEDKPQLYGTRFELKDGKLRMKRVADPAQLAARRVKLGLMPLDEYIKFMEEMYKLPFDRASLPR